MRFAASVSISTLLTVFYLVSCATGDASQVSPRSAAPEEGEHHFERQSESRVQNFDRETATVEDIAEYLYALPETRREGYRLISLGQTPVAGVFRAPHSRRDGDALLGLLQTDVHIAVIQAKTDNRGRNAVDIQPIGRYASVLHVEEIFLHAENGSPNGLRVRLASGNREEELIVLVAEETPYIL